MKKLYTTIFLIAAFFAVNVSAQKTAKVFQPTSISATLMKDFSDGMAGNADALTRAFEKSEAILQKNPQAASKRWTMPIKNRKQAINRFAIEFAEQLAPYM